MFEGIKLKGQIRDIERLYSKDLKKLQKENAPPEQFQQLEFSEVSAVQEVEKEIDQIVGTRLAHKARSLDVETPPISDTEMWQRDQYSQRIWFTPKGRAQVRKLIHEERTRRFEAKARWIPLLSIVLAIIGTITSLVAVTLQRKSVETAATAAGTARIGAELARKQLVGTLGAVVVFNPTLSGNKLIPILENHGRVVSPNAHISFRWNVTRLSNLNATLQEGTYSRTIPQVPAGGWSEPIDIGITIGQEFTQQKYTVKIEGTYDFDNGFGDRFNENFCSRWLGHAETKPDQGGIENTGAGLIPCNLFEEKLRYFQSHKLK